MGSILTKIIEIQDDLEFEIETLKKGVQTDDVVNKRKMRNNTIETFTGWSDIVDYESDDTSVILINSQRKKVVEYGYPGFTMADFERLRGACEGRASRLNCLQTTNVKSKK